MERLTCPACNRAFTTADLNPALGIATCPCGAVMRLGGGGAPAPRLDEPLQPPNWKASEERGQLLLRSPWRSATAWFLVLWCAIWDGIMLVAWVAVLAEGELLGATVLLPHSLIGAAMTWYMLALFLNSTTIRVGKGRLVVEVGPVPWFGARDLAAGEVAQLFVAESSVRVNRQPRWNLAWLDRKRELHTLVRLLRNPEEARWLEWKIEKRLDIADERVPGEV